MGVYRLMKFTSARNKYKSIYNNIITNENKIEFLQPLSYIKVNNSFIKKLNIISINTTPIYYDLYNFEGITFSTSEPEPASAYEYRDIGYYFIYPVWGFVVPSGETPESITDGATPWQFQTTIAIIKTQLNFPKMPDWVIDGAKVISYLYNDDDSAVGDLAFTILPGGENMDAIVVDFSEFHRWIKLEEGYNFEYYAIYPVPENHQLHLNTNLYIYNPKNNYYGQSKQI